MDAALEQLCRNFHLYNGNCHIICLPRLMTSRWRNHLLKVADLFVTVPIEENVWPESNFEPLILAIVLPFVSRNPWKLRKTKLVKDCEGSLQKMLKDNFVLGGNLLRELLQSTRSLETLPGSMVRGMLQFSGDRELQNRKTARERRF